MKTKNIYSFPLRKEDITRQDTSSPAHKGDLENAVDFLCHEGTRVFASCNVKVVEVISNKTQTTRDITDAGNFVLIEHENGEFSHYAHLQYKGIEVKKGQEVSRGKLIGYSGNTGFSFGPHLHFSVIKFEQGQGRKFQSLEIQWEVLTK